MSNEKQKNYQDRLKRMKDCVEKNKDILDSDFPDDVTIIGNPDLLEKSENEIEENSDEDSKNNK